MVNIKPDAMDFLPGRLWGDNAIGEFYTKKDLKVAVIYNLKGELVDCQIFDKEGNQIIDKKEKEPG